MSTIQHSAVTGADLHGIVAFTAASVSARNALSVVAGDIGKVCHVTADNTFYVLTSISPSVWTAMTPALAAVATSGAYADLTGTPTLATVATSGSYTDLSNQPTIPAAYTLPVATASVLGGVKAGSGVTIDGAGVISAAGTYSLPTATTSVLGGVKVDGTTVTIASGVISSTAPAFSAITSKPTTLAGYGITDGQTAAQVTTAITGYGYQTAGQVSSAVSAAAYSLPTASTTVLGGVKVDGTTVTIAAGVISAAAAGASLSAANTWTAGQRGAVAVLTPGTTVTPDFAASNNFSLTPAQAFTLANPTNAVAGQSGIIAITQDATGGRVISWGGNFKAAGGTKPVLTTAANAVDYISYYVESATRIFVSITADVK